MTQTRPRPHTTGQPAAAEAAATGAEPSARWAALRRATLATLLGLWAERITRAFWPVWTVAFAALAALMLGLHDLAPVGLVRALAVATVIALALLSWRGLRGFVPPSRRAALDRIDATQPGRPIAALLDRPAAGSDDPATRALWRAHQARMAERAARAAAVAPDLRVSARDPFALRYVAVLGLAVALLFGSVWRIGSVTQIGPGGAALSDSAPVWEGWIDPPAYTGLPTLYLADQPGDRIEVPEGARIILRFYGRVGDLRLEESVSAAPGTTVADGATGTATATATGAGTATATQDPSAPEQELSIRQSGRIAINGRGGRSWDITMRPDQPPEISVTGAPDVTFDGQMSLPFRAEDDYGVTAGLATITLDLDAVPRHHGLQATPEPRAPIELVLPLPVARDRADFTETLVENLSDHPWAHLPVLFVLQAEDGAGLTGQSQPAAMPLPARRFFDPVAAALIEQRRDLLWSRDNATRVAQMLRTIAHRPEDRVIRRETDHMRLRTIIRQLELHNRDGLDPDRRDEIAAALWDLALMLEEGDLESARERMRQAQERLEQAMKNGASEQEIARLMQDLRDATRDYMRQLAQQSQRDADQAREEGRGDPDNTITMTQDDIQRMMDHIQELMEQGRMAEAQQALEELQQLLENLQMSQSGQGDGPSSPGQEAMDDLAESLRDQQGLSDQAFRELQDRFNQRPGDQRGQQQGQQPGQQGQGQPGPGEPQGQGDGQPGDGPRAEAPGQGQDGEGEGQGADQGQGEGEDEGQAEGQGEGQAEDGQGRGAGQGQGDSAQSLADRQRALRQELDRQRGRLPGIGGAAGEAAREALDRAGRAMEQAEDALRRDDLPDAIGRQAEAMDALRDGIRNMGEALAEEQRQQGGAEGAQTGDAQGQQRDPLGRAPGSRGGGLDTQDDMIAGQDANRRARDLLDEIRRRSGEAARPEQEREYLRRLLDRF